MNVMKTLIVDDEPSARKGMLRILSRFPIVEVVGEAHSEKTLQTEIQKCEPDLILLDIMLRDTNSLDIMQKQKRIPLVIITTAYDNHALKGFDIKAVDYLMKPISEKKLYEAIERAFTLFSSNQGSTDTLFLRSKGRYVRFNTDEILFIEGLQNYIVIHTETGKHICKKTMKSIEQDLGKKNFIRIHKSYIINSNKVDGVEKQTLFIGEFELPIGKTMKNYIYHTLIGTNS